MDWLQFIASLVGSLAWPLVVALLLILLRGQLSGLAERLEELTLPGGAKAKFEKQLAKAIVTSEQIDWAPDVQHIQPQQAGGESLQLAKAFPEAAVLEAFKEVESLLIKIRSRLPGTSARSLNIVIQRLLDMNYIDENAYELFQNLREARNAAAHARTANGITPGEALEYQYRAGLMKELLQNTLFQLKPQ